MGNKTCPVYEEDVVRGLPPVAKENFREIAKLLFPNWKTNPYEKQALEQTIIKACCGQESEEELQMKGLEVRIQLARAAQGLSYRSPDAIRMAFMPQNYDPPAKAAIMLNDLRPYGLPAGTLPPYLDTLYEEYIDKLNNPPAPPV